MTLYDRIRQAWAQAPQQYPPGSKRYFGVFESEENETAEYKAWKKKTLAHETIKPKISHRGIPGSTRLHRFIDLPKFLDLLVNRRLLLPPIVALKRGDPGECSACPNYDSLSRGDLDSKIHSLERFAPRSSSFQKLAPYPELFEPSFSEIISSMPSDDLKQTLWFLDHARICEEIGCLCWYGNKMESDAMWRLYSNGVGVRITSTVDALKRAITCSVPKVLAPHVSLTLSRVTYSDEPSCGSRLPWLVKREAFRHEEEIRLFIDYPFIIQPGFVLKVDLQVLLNNITFSPYAPAWQHKLLERTIDEFIGTKGLRSRYANQRRVIKSTHLIKSEPPWPPAAKMQQGFRLPGFDTT